MMNKIIIFLLLALACLYWWMKDPTITVPTNGIEFGYIVKYPGNSEKSDFLPMLVALHGNGDTAKNFHNTALDRMDVPARIVLLKGPLRYGTGDAWPWTADDFRKYGKAVSEAVELLADKYPTNGKPILFGYSTGAMMACYQAVKHGDVYSSIFSVSGQISDAQLGDDSSQPGAAVFAFHGKSDDIILFREGEKAANILKGRGVEVHFAAFEGGHHGVFTNMKATITQAIEQKLKAL